MMKGYKTYLCAAIAVVVLGLNAAGVIPDTVRTMLLELCGFGGIAALRSAISNS